MNATLRFANASGSSLALLQNGNPLTGATSLAFGARSSRSRSSVYAATPLLSVIQVGSTTPLTGFTPALSVGTSFILVAYPNATGGVQFATFANTFTATTGHNGLRVRRVVASS